MTQEILDWNTVNWRKVYRRSHRPVELRGVSSPFFIFRWVGILLILLWASVTPRVQISWDWPSILILLAILIWLGWALWPVIENRWASRFVLKARLERKLEGQFWQKEMRPVIIDVREAFQITPQGKLIESSGWIGRYQVSIPAWLLHIVEKQEEVDLLCLSTRRILGKLSEFSQP